MTSVGSIGSSGINLTSTGQAQFGDQQNIFLNLLVAEMSSQNPLEPMDNQSFMEQMAQFSSMEQTREMNESLLDLLQYQGYLARMQGLDQGASLLGRIVDFDDGDGKTGSGEVQGVEVKDGKVILDLGDRSVPLYDVTGVRAKVDGADG